MEEITTPADDKDVLGSLTYALRFQDGQSLKNKMTDIEAQIISERLLKHLKLCGFSISKGPPAQPGRV